MYVITCTSYIARQNAWNVSCLCKFSHVLHVVCFIEPVNDQNYKMNLINSFNIKKTRKSKKWFFIKSICLIRWCFSRCWWCIVPLFWQASTLSITFMTLPNSLNTTCISGAPVTASRNWLVALYVSYAKSPFIQRAMRMCIFPME